ncbi:RNA 2'-phosphotransferase [Thaumasiovibrio subtropicus]|uniref:RNA 2'-phosphotransferase n=1 Tax=Thaumasiovibrio subtropicus TaxID=1891207 RepID=UPI000B362180|nr:RNA 2'-phosphotransferase [Thaumasiovibrio subtropicus]
MEKDLVKISKYLSYVLRHKPDSIGLKLDEQGWALIDELIEKTVDVALTRDLVDLVVETSDKRRFAIGGNGNHIRANQGHSIEVDLQLSVVIPPDYLLHGTAERNVKSIGESGLTKGSRHHVHLTESLAVAKAVGSRYGKPVIFTVDARRMHLDGYSFYKTVNNVWLTESVPSQYLKRT